MSQLFYLSLVLFFMLCGNYLFTIILRREEHHLVLMYRLCQDQDYIDTQRAMETLKMITNSNSDN